MRALDAMTAVDRVLLLLEWSDLLGAFCPRCFEQERHGPGCDLDEALSERGFCSIEERERGRAQIEAAAAETDPPPEIA